jgi:hypothetical protein
MKGLTPMTPIKADQNITCPSGAPLFVIPKRSEESAFRFIRL